MTRRFFILTLLLLCAPVALPLSSRAEEPAGTVILGQISLSFYAVTAGVVQEVLERLGHQVETVQGSHAQIFPRLGAGEVDLLVAAWLPHGHAVYWERYGKQAEALSVLYEGARFVWMVPNYVPAALVGEIDDLKRPEVAGPMNNIIRGTGRDSGNMTVSAEVVKAYGLEQVGYKLAPGAVAEFYQSYDRALAEQRWFVMPLWYPNYIHRAGTMRALVEPKGLLGEPNAGTLVASRAWVERAPTRTLDVMRRIRLGMDAVEEMDEQVNRFHKTPRQAAREWLERNRSLTDRWFEQR
jgi:glycine betaine/proline transport system substrate-binding protein